MSNQELSHLDVSGQAQMVDVGDKPDTVRSAVAKGEISMLPETLAIVLAGNLKKGDIFTIAKTAGILAAKRTADLIPLCHTLPLHHLEVEIEADQDLPGLLITATARTTGKTGVEMEALTAVAVTALTIYDMAKAVEKSMRIHNIRLALKSGGRSGEFTNE